MCWAGGGGWGSPVRPAPDSEDRYLAPAWCTWDGGGQSVRRLLGCWDHGGGGGGGMDVAGGEVRWRLRSEAIATATGWEGGQMGRGGTIDGRPHRWEIMEVGAADLLLTQLALRLQLVPLGVEAI